MIALIIIFLVIIAIILGCVYLTKKYEPNFDEIMDIDGKWLIVWYNSYKFGCRDYIKLYRRKKNCYDQK